MTGKELVNMFYQPLGSLRCGVSTDDLWAYAKDRAMEVVKMMLRELPMYTGNLNPQWQQWHEMQNEIRELP